VVYLPRSPAPVDGRLTVVVRTLPGASLAADIRRAIAAMNPAQTVTSFQSVKEIIEVGAQEVRVSVFMVTRILVLATLLAMTGIYGLLAQTVAQRTHEYALRVALGAGRSDLVRLVLTQAMAVAGAGAAVGGVGALMLDRALGSFLFGVPAEQGLALAGSAALILSVTMLASVAPCRRAVHIDPGKTLKYE
jgi:ABC-type antimicrobial peptide transport system permease subunit